MVIEIVVVSSLVQTNHMSRLPDTGNYTSWNGKIKYICYLLSDKWITAIRGSKNGNFLLQSECDV